VCKGLLGTWKSSHRLLCSTRDRIKCRTVPVSVFLTAAPDRGETIIVRPHEMFSFCIYVFVHNAHVSLHFFWWYELPCHRWCELTQARACMMMSPSHEPVIVGHSCHIHAPTVSIDTSSEPRGTFGTIECHRVKIGSNWWVSSRTFAVSSQPQDSSYLDFLATQPPVFTEMTDPLEANH
jgi:hypothetical protein